MEELKLMDSSEQVQKDTKEEKKWCVYMHISPSGKRYIGITSKQRPEDRWGKNGQRYLEKRSDGRYMHPAMANALLKYPDWNEWNHNILFQGLTEQEAKDMERCLIKMYNTRNYQNGYNCTDGGEGALGVIISDEAKEKMSKKAKERYKDKTKHPMYDVHRYGKDSPLYGKRHSEESKKKMSDAHKGKYIGEKNPMYNKHHTKETRKKMSNNHADFSHEKHPKSVPVYCIELNEIFWGASGATNKYGFSYRSVSYCCQHKKHFNSAGRHPETNEPLHWVYTSEAIDLGYITQKDIDNYMKNLKSKGE